MDDDMMTWPTFAGVIDLLEKQEVGLSCAKGDTCKLECYAGRLVHGSPPSARMTAFGVIGFPEYSSMDSPPSARMTGNGRRG